LAISIDWDARIIFIPKADTQLIVAGPPQEIRQLNLNDFRLALKALEESEEGMPFLDTHTHNSEVLLGGIVYARVVEIINGYTITFEDGQYAVNLIGANSNVGDVVNVNQVSVRSSNSAGLISNQAIEFSSFEGRVTVSAGSSYSGSAFPTGTRQRPVNNLSDALLIAQFRGLHCLAFLGDFTFDSSTVISDALLIGEGMQSSVFTFESGSIVAGCVIEDAVVTGSLSGLAGLRNCRIDNLEGVGLTPSSEALVYRECLISGTVRLPSNYSGVLKVLDCWANDPGVETPILDLGNSTADLIVRNYSGDFSVRNCTEAIDAEIDLLSGAVILESSVTAGSFVIRGVGNFENNSSGTTINKDGLINKESLNRATWDFVVLDPSNGVSGTKYPIGTLENPVDNFADAITIAQGNAIPRIRVKGSATLTTAISNLIVEGCGSIAQTNINLNGQTVDSVVFQRCRLSGILETEEAIGGGWAHTEAKVEFRECHLREIENLEGSAFNCWIEGATKIRAGGWFSSVETVIEGDYTVFNLQSTADTTVSMDINSGWAQFINVVGGCLLELNLKGGEVTLQESCTGGEYYLEGVGTLFNDSSMDVIENHLTWDEKMSYHQIRGSIGANQQHGVVKI